MTSLSHLSSFGWKGLLLAVAWLFGWGVNAQPLDSLIKQLREQNPQLLALNLEYRAAMAVGGQLDRLPDLEVGVGVFVLPVETRTGPQQFRVGATQMLPWPGKLAAMSALADRRAQPLLERAAATQLQLIYQLKTSYYRLAGWLREASVLRESLSIYAGLEAVALEKVANGRGSSVAVYGIQLERQRTERRLEEIDAKLERERIVINTLLDRPPEMTVNPVVDLPGSARLAIAQNEAIPYRDSLDNHPLLRIYEVQQAISRESIALNDLDAKPDFGIGLDYIGIGRRTDANPTGNGRDVLLPRASIRLPLGKSRYTAKRQEEELRIDALEQQRRATQNELLGEINRARVDIADAAARLRFLSEQLRLLEATLAIAEGEYANDRRPFEELLRWQQRLFALRVQRVSTQTDILHRTAVLDRYLINQ